MTYTITIWGSRGSIPTPGPQTARYGGNTSCVSIERDGGDPNQIVVLDAGSGIRPLGNLLVERGNGLLEVDLLVTHTHWDHIQGFPFFTPMFTEGNVLRIWGSKQGEVDLEVVLQQQMHPVVFPVPLEESAADLSVEHVGPGKFAVEGFSVEAMRLRHPGHTLGYKLIPEGGGPTLAYIMDNELGPGGHYEVSDNWRSELVEFTAGVDLMIHDAMYGPHDIEQHRGWGHSSYTEAVALAVEAEVKQLMLFHHRPERDDADMDLLVEAARGEANRSGHAFDVLAAVEGMQLTL